jgi:hypothetical protein
MAWYIYTLVASEIPRSSAACSARSGSMAIVEWMRPSSRARAISSPKTAPGIGASASHSYSRAKVERGEAVADLNHLAGEPLLELREREALQDGPPADVIDGHARDEVLPALLDDEEGLVQLRETVLGGGGRRDRGRHRGLADRLESSVERHVRPLRCQEIAEVLERRHTHAATALGPERRRDPRRGLVAGLVPVHEEEHEPLARERRRGELVLISAGDRDDSRASRRVRDLAPEPDRERRDGVALALEEDCDPAVLEMVNPVERRLLAGGKAEELPLAVEGAAVCERPHAPRLVRVREEAPTTDVVQTELLALDDLRGEPEHLDGVLPRGRVPPQRVVHPLDVLARERRGHVVEERRRQRGRLPVVRAEEVGHLDPQLRDDVVRVAPGVAPKEERSLGALPDRQRRPPVGVSWAQGNGAGSIPAHAVEAVEEGIEVHGPASTGPRRSCRGARRPSRSPTS